MAKLVGKDFKAGAKAFSLTPVKPKTTNHDATEYILTLWPSSSSQPVTHSFSVQGWQMGHDDIWILARSFAEAPALLNAVLPMDLWRIGRQQHAYLAASVDWLEVVMFGVKHQQQIRIILYVRECSEPTLYRRFFIQADAAQVAQFGLELEKEIIEANPIWALENNRISAA
jgi:hypothetical protein